MAEKRRRRRRKNKGGPKQDAPQVDDCRGKRARSLEDSSYVSSTPLSLADVGDTPIMVNFYSGCEDGGEHSKFIYSFTGDERDIVLGYTAEQVIKYAIGEPVKKGATVFFEARTLGDDRLQREPVDRLRQEVTGDGPLIKAVIAEQGPRAYHDGYTVTANGQQVTGNSSLNSFLTLCTFVRGDDGNPAVIPTSDLTSDHVLIERGGRPIEVYSALDVVVSAEISPGKGYQRREDYHA